MNFSNLHLLTQDQGQEGTVSNWRSRGIEPGRGFFFHSSRVVNEWNKLPGVVVSSEDVNQLKTGMTGMF